MVALLSGGKPGKFDDQRDDGVGRGDTFTRKTATAYELYIFGGATAEFAPMLLNDMWRLTIPFGSGD